MLRSRLENQKRNWPSLELFTLEHNYSSLLKDIMITLNNEDYLKVVKKYEKITDRKVLPISQKYVSSHRDLINNNLSLLKNAIELGRKTIEVSDSIAPILLHYSCHCLMGFFNYTLFFWDSPHAFGHGLFADLRNVQNDPRDINLEIREKGIFRRCLDVFTLLGFPIVFSKYIPKIEGIGADAKIKFESVQEQVLLQNPEGKISFEDILDYNQDWIDKLQLKEEEIIENRFGQARGLLNYSLVGYALIFIVSNIARYRPALWNEILLGKDPFNVKIITKYRIAIQYVFGVGYHPSGFIDFIGRTLKSLRHSLIFRQRIKGELWDHPINYR